MFRAYSNEKYHKSHKPLENRCFAPPLSLCALPLNFWQCSPIWRADSYCKTYFEFIYRLVWTQNCSFSRPLLVGRSENMKNTPANWACWFVPKNVLWIPDWFYIFGHFARMAIRNKRTPCVFTNSSALHCFGDVDRMAICNRQPFYVFTGSFALYMFGDFERMRSKQLFKHCVPTCTKATACRCPGSLGGCLGPNKNCFFETPLSM